MSLPPPDVLPQTGAHRLAGRAWRGAVGCFALAGLTGAFYRFGIAHGWTAGLELVNLRHAHSHLMYFGWVTPALMALVGWHLPAVTGRPLPARMGRLLAATFAAALVSYPFYLAFGYRPALVAGRALPLAMVVSSLNVLCWYAYVWMYWQATRGVARTRALLVWDLAATFLVLSSLGAWALALLKPLGVDDPAWIVGLTHVFLDLFSEGWVVLGVIGLLYARAGETGRAAHWSLVLVVLGLPVTFAMGMPEGLVPPGLRLLARAGATLVAVGLLATAAILWRQRPAREGWRWTIPLALLAAKALAQLLAGVAPGTWWTSGLGMRILYLHLMLLGFVTLGLVAVAAGALGRPSERAARGFYAAVLLLLLSLLPLTALWPVAWMGPWGFVAAACVAPAPVLAALWMLAPGRRRVPHPA